MRKKEKSIISIKIIVIIAFLCLINLYGTVTVKAEGIDSKKINELQSFDDTEIESLESFLKRNFNGRYIKDIESETIETFTKSKLKIISKKLDWNEELVLENKPKKLVMHHIEASRSDSNVRVEEIHQWHKNNGWAGIGYHFYINKKGEIYRGRPENAIGAHAKNHNIDTIGIAVEGKYNEETMPKVQKDAVVSLGKYLRQKYKIDTIKKHKDLVATSCPGNNYPFEDVKNSVLEEKLISSSIYEWRKEAQKLFLYDEWLNEKAEGEIEYKEKKYKVDKKNGLLNKGFVEIDKIKYYMKDNHEYAVGWEKINDIWHYFDSNGVIQKGWQWIGDKWYYFDATGKIQNGWKWIENHWYYFNGDGSMAKGWIFIDGWYYMDQYGGQMQTGWKWENDKWYYLNNDGSMAKGWVYNNGWYYMDKNSGEMQNEWQFIDDEWYYLNSGGQMQVGWSWIEDSWYYFAPGGEMSRGWDFVDNNWYYFTYSGNMVTNKTVDGWYLGYDGIAIKVA